MTVVRRSAGLGTLLLSVLGLLLCVAGTFTLWAGKSGLDRIGVALFGATDEALAFVEVKLDKVKQAVDSCQQRVTGVSRLAERLRNAEADVRKECEPLLQTLDAVFDELKSAESWLESGHAVANGVSRVSEAVVSSKYGTARQDSAVVAVASEVQEFSEAVADELAKLQAMRQELIELRDKGKLTREIAVGIVVRVADLDGRLANLSARIGKFEAEVRTTRTASIELGQRVRWWTTIAAVTFTVVLLWFGISQIGMMKFGWQLVCPSRTPEASAGAASGKIGLPDGGHSG